MTQTHKSNALGSNATENLNTMYIFLLVKNQANSIKWLHMGMSETKNLANLHLIPALKQTKGGGGGFACLYQLKGKPWSKWMYGYKARITKPFHVDTVHIVSCVLILGGKIFGHRSCTSHAPMTTKSMRSIHNPKTSNDCCFATSKERDLHSEDSWIICTTFSLISSIRGRVQYRKPF